MSEEQRDFDIDQAKGTRRSCVSSAVHESNLTHYKAGKPIALGFVLGAVYFLYVLATGRIADISLVQLLMQLAALIGLCTIAIVCFKNWMGIRWSSQHVFVRTSLFVASVFYGVALFVMAFGFFGYFTSRV